MPTYDDLWSKFGALDTTGMSTPRTPSQDTGKKPDLDAMWGNVSDIQPLLNPLTEGKPKEEVSTLSDIGQSALAGGIRGAAALPGLPGDVASLIRYGGEQAKYYGKKADEAFNFANKGAAEAYKNQLEKERASPDRAWVGPLPTSEATTKMAEEAFPAAKYEPKTVAGRFTKTTAEFLPSAVIPIGEASLLARAGTAAASGVGSELAGTLTKGTAAEPFARIAGAFAGPVGISAASKTIGPTIQAFRNPEEAAIKQLANFAQTESASGMEGRRTYQQLINERAKEIANNVPEQESIVRAADLFASSPADIIKNLVNEKNMLSPEIRQQAQNVMQGLYDRAAENKTYLAQNIAEVTNPYTTSVVNRYRAAQGLDPISGSIAPDELKAMAQSIARTRNEAAYGPAYEQAQNVWNSKLESVLNSPQGQKAAWNAVDELNNSLAGKGQETRDWLREVRMPGSNRTTLKLEGGLEGLPLEFWDRFGRNLRQGPDSGVTKNLINRLDQGVAQHYGGEINNPYTQAKSMARTGFLEGDAYSAGSNILKDARATLDPAQRNQFLTRFGNLGDEEKALYSAGVSQAIQARAAGEGGLAYVTKLLNNPENAKVLQEALDWNLPQGAYSNFERIKNTVDIANNINKVDKIKFIEAQPSVQSWFNRHPFLKGAGLGEAALEAYNIFTDFHLINTPRMFGALAIGYGLDKFRSVTSNRQAMEVLRILDSRDPAMIAKLSQEIQRNPETRTAYQKVTDMFNIMDKRAQDLYKKAALIYAGGQARAIESKERMGMRKDGGRVNDVPHKFYGGAMSYNPMMRNYGYNNNQFYNPLIMNLLRNFYTQQQNYMQNANALPQAIQQPNYSQFALPASTPFYHYTPYNPQPVTPAIANNPSPVMQTPSAPANQFVYSPPINIQQKQQQFAAQNNIVSPTVPSNPQPAALPTPVSEPQYPSSGGIFNNPIPAPSGYTGPTAGPNGAPSTSWGLKDGGRVERATGGRIPEADKMFKSAKKYVDSRTKGLMNLHDDVIVHALRVAKSRGH